MQYLVWLEPSQMYHLCTIIAAHRMLIGGVSTELASRFVTSDARNRDRPTRQDECCSRWLLGPPRVSCLLFFYLPSHISTIYLLNRERWIY